MILDCAACGARYLLAERAIGPDGRHVRCARCSASWFAGPKAYELIRPLASLPPGRGAFLRVGPAAALPTEGRRQPHPLRAALSPWRGHAAHSGDFRFRPRQTPASVLNWLAAGSCVALLLASGAAVALANGAAAVRQRAPSPIGAVTQSLRISLLGHPGLGRIASGSTLVTVSGRIHNPTALRISVPDVIADLRNDRGMPIYSWTIHMPRSMLAARDSIDFDTSQLDVPATVKSVRLSFLHRMTPGGGA